MISESPAPRLWQRQPGETPADFTAFVTYLRLKGRRSCQRVARQTGRSLAAIRRLAVRFDWPGRVAAFEARLADASENALDHGVRGTATRNAFSSEQLRAAEFQLAHQTLLEAGRWLRLASDPRRRDGSLAQVCRVIDLASKLSRLAAGMPVGEERRRSSNREQPGCGTGSTMGDALERIYGSPPPANSTSPEPPPPRPAPIAACQSR